MQSQVEPLEGNKVKLRIAVPEDEFDRALDKAFKKIAREVKIPGFRPGKAPRKVLEARIGKEVARDEALRDALPEYYADALRTHDVDAIALPEIEITAGQDDGDIEFEAVVEVRPVVEIDGYRGLRVEIPYQPVDDDMVDRQIDRLRDRFADLEESEHPLVDGAYATIDLTGRQDGEEVEGLSVSDFLYEVGSEMVVPELDEHLRGTRPGAILTFSCTLPERFGDRAGQQTEFTVVVKEAKRKVLPEVTDEWVSEASEFDTVDELRADIRERLERLTLGEARMVARERVLEAASALVPIEAPATLVDDETSRRVRDLAHRLQHQNATLDDYLAATGTSADDFVAQVREGATKAVLADLAVRAIIAQEAIEPSDEDVEEQIARFAAQIDRTPAQVRRELERDGAIEAIRSDLARAKAIELLLEAATVVSEAGDPVDLRLDEIDDDGAATLLQDHDHEHDHEHDEGAGATAG